MPEPRTIRASVMDGPPIHELIGSSPTFVCGTALIEVGQGRRNHMFQARPHRPPNHRGDGGRFLKRTGRHF